MYYKICVYPARVVKGELLLFFPLGISTIVNCNVRLVITGTKIMRVVLV